MGSRELVTQSFTYDGGRNATVAVPTTAEPQAVVYCADGGWHIDRLLAALDGAGDETTVLVGVHGKDDDEGRLAEYVPIVDPPTFDAHERFFVDDVGGWVRATVGIDLPRERTAVWGASLGGELALALGVRHPNVFGAVFSASPGGGYRPPETGLDDPAALPRTYLVAGEQEPFFADNAARWHVALEAHGVDAVFHLRAGDHGGTFWYEELPKMVRWAFGSDR